MKQIAAAAAGTLVFAAAPASAMTVAEFLAKAHALQAKGPLAMFSPDVGVLKTELKGIAADYRADLAAARAAGKPPHSCPPPQGKTGLEGKQFLAELEMIPPAQRGMSMKTALYAIMKRHFPCR